jgi:hypothetical protein
MQHTGGHGVQIVGAGEPGHVGELLSGGLLMRPAVLGHPWRVRRDGLAEREDCRVLVALPDVDLAPSGGDVPVMGG